MIKDWGLESKVMCLTVGNATNNDSIIPLLQERLSGHSSFPCDGAHLHIYCTTQILNLIVKDGLKSIDPTVKLVRNNIKYINLFEPRMNRYRDFVISVSKNLLRLNCSMML